jgi:hypothetical protein
MKSSIRITFILLATFTCWNSVAFSYIVGPAKSLEKLTQESDLIFKGKVIGSDLVQLNSFKDFPNYSEKETKFQNISILKGHSPGDEIIFQHYTEKEITGMSWYSPQFYNFSLDQTYIVFAKKTERGKKFQQLQKSHTSKIDQGVFLCDNDTRRPKISVKEAVWQEMMALLQSSSPKNIIYSIQQLDDMSAGKAQGTRLQDYDRELVLKNVAPLIQSDDEAVVNNAVSFLGSHNPYLKEERTLFWLTTVGSAKFPGIGEMDQQMKNLGGERFHKELIALASHGSSEETRSKAILALGLIGKPYVYKALKVWLRDPSPLIRASATLLLADFSHLASADLLRGMASDESPNVRGNAAKAIGFGQNVAMTGVLENLLWDGEAKVRKNAAMSLLSFSLNEIGLEDIFKRSKEVQEFKPLFLNALARSDASTYLNELAYSIENNITPKNFWGGRTPSFSSWEIMFSFLQGKTHREIRSGKYNPYLDTLEKVGNYSSSEPRDIYAFYLQRNMGKRAKAFRAKAKKNLSYDIDYYFNQVDENPERYHRK